MGGIDFDGMEPIYVQAADLLRSRIQDGTYPAGRRLPSVPALCQELGIAKATVSKALDLLKSEGLIRGVKGRGTFVLPPAEPPAAEQDGAAPPPGSRP